MIRTLILAALAMVLAVEAEAVCQFKFCDPAYQFDRSARPVDITNTSRQIVGDLYQPRPGARVQVRNNSRQILGYVESDGSITNTSRQIGGEIGDGLD